MPSTSSEAFFGGGRWPSTPFEAFPPATISFPYPNIAEIKQDADPGKKGWIEHDELK